MRKATLWSLGGIVLASSLALNAQVMQISKGWQILGASDDIANMSVFKSDCVSTLYTYRNSTDGYRTYSPSSKFNQLNSLKGGDGFWINGLKNCTVDTTATSSTTPPPLPTAGIGTTTTSSSTDTAGLALYSANCAGCHGNAKLGKSEYAITVAIANNTGGMGSLSLSATQIAAIAAATTTTSTTTTSSSSSSATTTSSSSTATTGGALYDANCAGCHGNSKLGKSASSIASAIASNRGGMGSLKFLSATQIAAITAASNSTTSYSSGKKNDDDENENDDDENKNEYEGSSKKENEGKRH